MFRQTNAVVEIVKQMKFAAAHTLPYQGWAEGAGKGKCTQLHGHTYVLEVGITGPIQVVSEQNPESGMVIDFGRLGHFMKAAHDQILDHHHLNVTLDAYPTAERIAFFMGEISRTQLEPTLPPECYISRVRVYEEHVFPQAWAEVKYSERASVAFSIPTAPMVAPEATVVVTNNDPIPEA